MVCELTWTHCEGDASFVAPTTAARRGVARRGLSSANPTGLAIALFGLAGAYLLGEVSVSAFDASSHTTASMVTFGGDLSWFAGFWLGLIGTAIFAVRSRPRQEGGLMADLASSFGLSLRWWPDLPVGIALGVVAQFVLVPLFELPLVPFVPHLFHRLNGPAHALTANVNGPGLVLLGILVCAGAPIVEELYFRGVFQRALLGWFLKTSPRIALPATVIVVGAVFGLVHFEALELSALVGFGMLLSVTAFVTGRLGTGIVAHAAFNSVTFISLALIHP